MYSTICVEWAGDYFGSWLDVNRSTQMKKVTKKIMRIWFIEDLISRPQICSPAYCRPAPCFHKISSCYGFYVLRKLEAYGTDGRTNGWGATEQHLMRPPREGHVIINAKNRVMWSFFDLINRTTCGILTWEVPLPRSQYHTANIRPHASRKSCVVIVRTAASSSK